MANPIQIRMDGDGVKWKIHELEKQAQAQFPVLKDCVFDEYGHLCFLGKPYVESEGGFFRKFRKYHTPEYWCFGYEVNTVAIDGAFVNIESRREKYDEVAVWLAQKLAEYLKVRLTVVNVDLARKLSRPDACPYCGMVEGRCTHCGAPLKK